MRLNSSTFSTSIDDLLLRKHNNTFFISDWNKASDHLIFPTEFVQKAIATANNDVNRYYFVDEFSQEKAWYLNNVLYPEKISLSDSQFAITSNGTISAYLAIHVLNLRGRLHTLVFSPIYFTYLNVLHDFNATIDYYQCDITNNDVEIDFDEVENIIVNNQINSIIINDPLFGSGMPFGDSNYLELIGLCGKYNVWLLVDYIYGGMKWNVSASIIDHNLINCLIQYSNTIIIESISKRVFLNGIKCSVVYADKDIIRSIESASVSILGAICCTQNAMFREIYDSKNRGIILNIINKNIESAKNNYELIKAMLIGTDMFLTKTSSGYFTLMGIPYYRLRTTDENLAAIKILEKVNILTIPHDRYLFSLDGYYIFRVNLAKDTDDLVTNIEKLLYSDLN